MEDTIAWSAKRCAFEDLSVIVSLLCFICFFRQTCSLIGRLLHGLQSVALAKSYQLLYRYPVLIVFPTDLKFNWSYCDFRCCKEKIFIGGGGSESAVLKNQPFDLSTTPPPPPPPKRLRKKNHMLLECNRISRFVLCYLILIRCEGAEKNMSCFLFV